MIAIGTMLTVALTAEAFAVPVLAAKVTKPAATESTDTSAETNGNDENKSGATVDESNSESSKDTASSTSSSDSGSTTSKKSSSKKSSSSAASTPKYDAKGNLILMTDSQRKARFWSKTNPKRGSDPNPKGFHNMLNGFAYADFGTFNSYNSDNSLGGIPIYMIGTITDIEKVYEAPMYYGCAIMVTNTDGYQWYVRANIAKLCYANFRALYMGQTGYLFGLYSGYSGVTNRPMMDMTVIYPNGGVPIDMRIYK